ncbi:MAG: cytochrome c [Ramlibacter sp.]
MRLLSTPLLLLLAFALPALGQSDFPAWAYPLTPGAPPPIRDEGKTYRVPESNVELTLTQIRNRFQAADWHPSDHPAMPPIVANGKAPDVWACGICHRPGGTGGPENAGIAGLPADYIVQQLKDLASGARSTAVPERRPHQLKTPVAKGLTEQEMAEAARYFAALKPQQLILVTESATAPKLRERTFFFSPTDDGAREPIGNRIVEYPEDVERFELLRDGRVRFIAWVPPGSIARGEALVKSQTRPGAMACASCHGADLKGVGSIPPIAGRSPTYIVRQLWDLKQGARNGAMAPLMKPIVMTMSSVEMVDIASYLATLKP